MLKVPSITLNGTDLSTTLNNCAKLDAANTFTESQHIKKGIYIGNALSTGNTAVINYSYAGANHADNYLAISHWSYDYDYRFYRDRVVFDNNLSVPSITLNGNDLQTSLNGKASLTHTHTLSEITDYVAPTGYDDTNCAKLNAANTFTANQTISATTLTMSNANPVIDMTGGTTGMLKIKCGTNDYARFYGGQTGSNAGYLEIATADDNNEPIYIRQYKGNFATLQRTLTLMDASGNTTMPGTLSVPAITLNGTSLATTLNEKASLTHTHTADEIGMPYEYEQSYSVGGQTYSDTYTGTRPLSEVMQYDYIPNSSYNKLTVLKPLEAPKLDTTNTTASAALGTNLQNAIFDLVYPIGSIYISYTPLNNLTNVEYGDFGVRWTFHGCVFTLMPANTFIKNIDWLVADVGSGPFYTAIDAAGDTGGSSTHNHTTGNHTLTINEIPSHNHLAAYWSNGAHVDGGYGDWGHPLEPYDSNNNKKYTSNTGGGQAHNHGNTGNASSMPPYITCYMWRRTA